VLAVVVLLSFVAACAPPAEVVEKEVIVEKEVPVTVVVETEKIVEKPVIETVVVEKEVVVEKVVEKEGERVIRVGARSKWGPGFAQFTLPSGKAQGDLEFYVYMTLYIHNGSFDGVPWLAKDVEISEESETTRDCQFVTFYLHEDAEWSDGTPLTSADVKFTMERLTHPDVLNRHYYWIGEEEYKAGEADHIEGIVLVDDHTVRFEYNEGYEACQPNVEEIGTRVSIVPKHIYEDIPLEALVTGEHDEVRHPTVVSGPFLPSKVETNVFIEAVARDDWWGAAHYGEPKVDKLILISMEPVAQLPALVAGQLDVTRDVVLSDIEGLKANPDLKILTSDSLSMLGIQYNRRPESLPDKIRYAMDYATDRDAIVAAHTLGLGTKVYSFLTNEGEYATPGLIEWREYDPEMARQLIQEAIDAGEWDPNRTIRFIDAGEVPVWNLWIEMMRQVGLDVQMEIVGLAFADRLLAGDWDVSPGGGGGIRGKGLRACSYFRRPYGIHLDRTGWYSEEFGDLCTEARSTLDKELITENVARMTEIWYAEGPWITYSTTINVWGVRSNICGATPPETFRGVGRGGAEYGIFDWYICD